jgi:hypothetical protein
MPYVLPTPEPRRRWYNDYGEFQGLGARLLLAMLSGGTSELPRLGKSPTTPTASNPGQLQFPSGAKTNTSPLEQAMISQLGGVPTRQGSIVPLGDQSGVTYKPPTRFGFGQSLDRQSTQADINLKNNQAEYWKSLVGMTQNPTPSTTPSSAPTPTPRPAPAITSPTLQKLYQGAQSGNTAYMDAIRNLYLEKGDQEAYLILQSLGEVD